MAALAAWALVGLPVLLAPGEGVRFAAWLGAFLAFGAALATGLRSTEGGRDGRIVAMGVQSLAVSTLALLLCSGFEGALLALVAVQLGLRLPRGPALVWILAQSGLLTLAVSLHWSPRPALLLGVPYLGFQALAFFSTESLLREAQGRRRLSEANERLQAMGGLATLNARLGERLRIARDLHDVMGHNLVALRLNLEAIPPGGVEADDSPLSTARSLVKALHDDVEGIVRALKDDPPIDLGQALESLARRIPRPRVHIELNGLRVESPGGARALLRCCQEMITNSAKHSDAENVWIAFHRRGSSIELRARDDGQVSCVARGGEGLPGMADRLAELGGSLVVRAEPGKPFQATAVLPDGEAGG